MVTAAEIENPAFPQLKRAPRPIHDRDRGGRWDGPPLTLTPALRRVAERCVWFEPPERAVADVPRFAAYIYTYGNAQDWATLREQLPDRFLPALLDAAPPGIFDKRSWAYWNLIAGRDWRTCPPLPVRTFSIGEAADTGG